jgi:hypothetical protein
MASFSERQGFRKPKTIQHDGIDSELRNSLWNVCRHHCFQEDDWSAALENQDFHKLAVNLYVKFYKYPVDNLPYSASDFLESQLQFFEQEEWYRVLDLAEFLYNTAESVQQQAFGHDLNTVLELEKSAYRLVAGAFVPITNAAEISEIEQSTLHSGRFVGVGAHMKAALEQYRRKPDPDYRNTIKEAISAVEAAGRVIANNPTATLGDAIKFIDRQHSLHPAFRDGILKLYGFTSDEGGIRHGMTEAPNVDETDARFMLVLCSAVANYLISRYDDSRSQAAR